MTLKDFSPESKPSFCIIAPVNYLESYATQTHTHLVLAHIVDTNKYYADFYRGMSDRGDRVIMDNGAFELGESYAPEKLVELGHMCGADAIVLPDYPGQHHTKTIEAAKKLLPIIKDEGFKAMFAPQAEVGDLEGWIRCYDWAAGNDNIDIIGMSILAIPNALPHIPVAYARVVMTELLVDRAQFAGNKYHHYLGLNAAPNVELPPLIQQRLLNSCDSSGPVWSGINGFRYNESYSDWMGIEKKYLREVDFDQEWTTKQHIHSTIQHNIDMTLSLFK